MSDFIRFITISALFLCICISHLPCMAKDNSDLIELATSIRALDMASLKAQGNIKTLENSFDTKQKNLVHTRKNLDALMSIYVSLTIFKEEIPLLSIEDQRQYLIFNAYLEPGIEQLEQALSELRNSALETQNQIRSIQNQIHSDKKYKQDLEKQRRTLVSKLTRKAQKKSESKLVKNRSEPLDGPVRELLNTARKPGFLRRKKIKDTEADKTPAKLPIAGRILVNYGDVDTIGATSQGLYIEGTKDGVITSPMKGVIRYAGPFKKFKNIILIDHKDGFYSILSGFDRVTIRPGQKVKKGYPVGILNEKQENAQLYYELRKNRKPVNPLNYL